MTVFSPDTVSVGDVIEWEYACAGRDRIRTVRATSETTCYFEPHGQVNWDFMNQGGYTLVKTKEPPKVKSSFAAFMCKIEGKETPVEETNKWDWDTTWPTQPVSWSSGSHPESRHLVEDFDTPDWNREHLMSICIWGDEEERGFIPYGTFNKAYGGDEEAFEIIKPWLAWWKHNL